MIKDVIDHYHSLLNDQLAADAVGIMNVMLRERKCYFGDRPLCSVLRPHFFEPEHWAYLKYETEILLTAFRRAHDACMSSSELRAQLDLESYEESLFSLHTGYEVPWTTSRLDSFYHMDARILRFVEYNAETPAGMAYEDALAEVFPEIEPIKRFSQKYAMRGFSTAQGLVQSLLDVWRQFGGQTKPNVGIIDWADVPTLNEHELCKMHFEAEGARAILADPRALEYRHGKLWAGDFPIDLIYKRVLSSELIMRMGLDNPVVRAVKDGAVCMSNAFSAKLMAKKASFALLSDEANHWLFDEEQLRVIEEHIPWTRRVSDRRTVFHGREIDLLPFIAEHRDQLVLKPNDEYGGKGVVIGWETSSEAWNATIMQALNEPYVVQERVSIAYEDYPSVVDDRLHIGPRLVDTDPFIYFGRTTSGSMTRLSTTTLLNVTAGGGSVTPTFIVYKRD